ncbi:MAG: 30S ribosome-binding factor RbfA [Oscillospiraceae bacterium]|nr:30S ribosome-binding factor RbfA [Oscillospiraceae bacterium]
MSVHKIDRISSDIKREISLILGELDNPRIRSIISVVRVDVTQDLSICRVYVSIMGEASNSAQTFKILRVASGFIRKRLSLRLSLRRTPEVRFIRTNSIEYGAKLEKIFGEFQQNLRIN